MSRKEAKITYLKGKKGEATGTEGKVGGRLSGILITGYSP
jgi:hypothetical protein